MSKPDKFAPVSGQVTAEALQSRLVEFFDDLQSCDLLRGRLLTGQALVTGGANLIYHGLGRVPLGFIVVSSSVDSTFWQTVSTALPNSSQLDIRCSADTTASVWVF